MSDKYILDVYGEPVPVDDLVEWGRWFEANRNGRIVKQQRIGPAWVSTVFLALDHSWRNEGPPILWETMVFGGPMDQEQDRCSGNRQNAEVMHQAMVMRVNEAHTPWAVIRWYLWDGPKEFISRRWNKYRVMRRIRKNKVNSIS